MAIACTGMEAKAQGAGPCSSAQEEQLRGRSDLLIEYFGQCIDAPGMSQSDKAEYYHKRGRIYALTARFDLALEDFGRSLRLRPGFASVHIDRGTTLSRQGQHEHAIGSFDQAIRLDPGSALAYNRRGEVYYAQGRLDRALNDYEQALAIDPTFAEAYNNRGLVYAEQGKLKRAIADYDKALSLNPVFSVAYYNRGNAYSEQGALDRAMEDFDQGMRLRPGDARAHHNRGIALFEHGRFDEAAEDFRQALEIAPGNAYSSIWLYLAQARGGGGDGRNALRRNTERLDPKRWPAPVVGMFLDEVDPQVVIDAGKPSGTRSQQERRCEAWFYAGQNELLAGRHENARKLFKAVLRTGITNFFEFSAARAELNRMVGG